MRLRVQPTFDSNAKNSDLQIPGIARPLILLQVLSSAERVKGPDSQPECSFVLNFESHGSLFVARVDHSGGVILFAKNMSRV
jgi:hypothetical protein